MINKLILAVFLLLSISSLAQEKRKWKGSFLLSGEIENVKSGEIILQYTNVTRKGEEIKEKVAAIADGKFGFSDFLEEPVSAVLKVGDISYKIYLDPTQISVFISETGDVKVSGSWTNDDYIKIVQLEERISGLADAGKKNIDGNLAELSYASVVKDSFIVLKRMLEVANPDHPLHSEVRCKQMIGILMNMSDELKNTPTGVRTSEALFISSVKMFAQ